MTTGKPNIKPASPNPYPRPHAPKPNIKTFPQPKVPPKKR
jgi:hypothetical protein